MKSRFIQFGAIVPVLAMMVPGAAQALPAVFRGIDNSIWIQASGSTPVEILYTGVTATRKITATTCGTAKFNPSATNPTPSEFTFGGTTIQTNSLTVMTMPSCSNGVLAEARPNNFRTAEGAIVLVGNTPAQPVEIQYPRSRARSAAPNLCGYSRFSSTQSSPHGNSTEFTHGVDQRSFSNLTQVDVYCRRGTLYQAVSAN
jgi:hypothetical protein